MSAWLKSGLIVGVVIIVINLFGLIPIVGACISLPLTILAYIAAGILAASYLTPPVDSGKAAGQGALAAIIAAFIGGVVNVIISLIRVSSGGLAQWTRLLNQLPPDLRYQIPDLERGTGLLAGAAGGAVCGSLCCLFGVLLAAGLGAAGAAIYASTKS